MSHKRILVTGGTGFIGSNLVRRLVRDGYDVVVFDNDFRGSKERLEDAAGKGIFIKGDIRDKNDVLKAVRGCDTVFHLAFINGTKYFYEQPKLVMEVGVKGALNTLEAALETGVKKYILASSSEVYQQPTHVPTTENERLMIPDPLNPRYSYGGGKLISELLTLNYLRGTDIDHMIFRPHNIFGPQMGFEHVIPEIMQKLYAATNQWNEDACVLEIQGSGEESRAFCYVDDAVDQIMTVADKGQSGQIYHVGMDEEITIRQLIEDIADMLGIKIQVKPGQLRQGGTSRRCPSIEKVKSLGYRRQNRYQEGLRKSVTWYKQYFLEQQTVNK